ncbi:molybdate ABC transporter permease subunit [Sphaerospermopsis aphanizomenoides BCCUSP55]|uniref:molybdate ABC transporter permease subunit n=1 Tax=Sphaerospermopsis aphanizomenoides TaxID=459663 RepID=UPI001907F14D|nr:molybdate ABC transporter permease subunit [Sphaerospermopsis aphanizomenoides]MBK1986563.1 molybdate ABC transporter permease subunit [Sphaerospermopsis aphanizomenoides BCCUSP55]
MPQDLSPLWISLKTSFLATFITFFLGITAAYWMLGYRGKGKSIIEGIFVAPLILPPTVVGFLLLLLFGKNGLVGKLMEPFNFTVVFTWYGAAIAATVVSFPLMYKTSLGAFEQIDANLLRVARTLGAKEFTIFWRVSLPLALPGILAGATLAFARALGEFGATLMLAGNIPGQTQNIPMAIYFAVEAGDMNEAWFWAIVIVAISLSGIILTNLWQESKHKFRSKDKAETRQIELENQSLALPLTSSSGLFLDIEKKLSSFHLQVAFNTDNQPLGLLGGSGAGKSMILRCIAGIETPTKGRIVLNDRVLFDSEKGINVPSRNRQIGFLFQNYALFPHLTVAQNIAFGLPKELSNGNIKLEVEKQLIAMELQGLGDRYPHQLSGGQQQRVALARALASQPEALLLDEPFSALDTHLRSQLEQQLTETLADYSGVTLFVTHNMEEAYRLCPNLLVLEHGKEAHHGSKYEIFQHPATMNVAKITGCKNFSRAVFVSSQKVEAVDWGCTLDVVESIPNQLYHIGIRAHQIVFTNDPNQENTFPCWLVRTSETPHRMTLFLKLHSPAENIHDYHLQAEVYKEKWVTIKDLPFPWYVHLDPVRLMLMEE